MNLNIALLPGDGVGEEVTRQAVKCIRAACRRFHHSPTFTRGLVGGAAIDATSNPYPPETHQLCLAADAILFGAIGSPRHDNAPVRPEQGLLDMRRRLGLYANIRPVTPFPSLLHRSPLRPEIIEGTDILFIRELTGGIYFGQPRGRSEDGNTAFDACVYTRQEIHRVCTLAFERALERQRRLTVVDKANVLATSRLWRETVRDMTPSYPTVTVDYMYVDNAAMQIIRDPSAFDVIVTENMFGDILTDEASVIAGSLGLLPSASTGLHTPLFEPIHGSYPQAAGRDVANPLASILSAAMMFEIAFSLPAEGAAIRRAVEETLAAGVMTEDLRDASSSPPPVGTEEMGDRVAARI
ncbi:MAG: 3-isopropylmalate dehydrogenase [Odoribacteraceae bacterium]|jgi:3-isopropylmalate dehydrogenase|nr:3-isopropylmalate dehydrogenase [Odoribacteraceae bacterium]